MRYQLGVFDYNLVSQGSVVLLTGNAETAGFCRDVADKIKRLQNGDIWTCTSLAEFEERARHPAFLGRWWFSGSADRLTVEDKRAFNLLIKKPVEWGTAVLTGTDFSKYKDFTRQLKNSANTHEIATSFPHKRFLVEYVRRGVIDRGCLISQGCAESFVWRMGDNYSSYEYYLDMLVAELPDGVKEIKVKHLTDTLKGVAGASFDDFLCYLLRPLSNGGLKRTNKLFKVYRCIVEDGALKALRKLHAKSLQYLEIRRLINEGYIPVGVDSTVAGLAKLLGEPPNGVVGVKKQKGSKFTCWDILGWSDMKFRREVEVAARAPLADWYMLVLLSSRRCSNDTEAERVFFDILTRSRQTNIEKII